MTLKFGIQISSLQGLDVQHELRASLKSKHELGLGSIEFFFLNPKFSQIPEVWP